MDKYELKVVPQFPRTAWLHVNGRAFMGNDVYLMVSRAPLGGYNVKGIIGFGGMGYNGYISTVSLVRGLKRLGIDINAAKLRRMLKG